MRFVPLAMVGDKPNSINTDKEMVDPPPANVLINPTAIPEVIKIKKSIKLMFNFLQT
jgi:hypothetical protein